MNYFTSTRWLWTAITCAFTLATGSVALADDTEIFFGQNTQSGPETNPNILLILDSSGSMNRSVPDDPLGRDRLKVVQDVANDFVATMNDVNIGLMKYDVRALPGDLYSDGGMVVHAVANVASSRTSLSNEINKIVHVGATPLQETYFEAARYMIGETVFYGKNSYEGYRKWGNYYNRSRPSVTAARNGDTYDSPMIGACQRNYIVYLTDGAPTRDQNGTPVITGLLNDPDYTAHEARSCDNPDGLTGGGECLDELAEFLYDNDFNTTMPGKQNVISHFIGFAVDLPFLERAAELGGGSYQRAADAATLRTALTEIFNNVSDDVNGFTAPAVTVNAFDRTTHLDQLFFTVFQPDDKFHWNGNVKKYRFVPRENDDGLLIVDKNGDAAVDPDTGFFYDGRDMTGAPDASVPVAWSYWSDEADGADVTKGGAAGEFDTNRKVLTNSGGGSVLSALDRDNDAVRSALSGFPVPYYGGSEPNPAAANDAVLNRWLDWAAGLDPYDFDGDDETDDARNIMGDPLHSKPSVVVYGGDAGTTETVLFVGTNDGYMHAINGNTGEEHFAFMPKELWKNIPHVAENPKLGVSDRKYGVDGPITVWKDDGGDGQIDQGTSDFVHLYFGLRRGGSAYYALDVTNPDQPKFMWDFTDADSSKLGQSWSQPVRATVNFGSYEAPQPKDVLIIGGGYDPSQDGKSSYSDDSVGNAVFMLDAKTGSLLWSASKDGANLKLSDMKSSIPAGVRAIDLNLDGMIDRMYTVDVAGRMWRFDIHNDESFEITAGVIAELGGTDMDGASNNRRFYYSPDVALGTEAGRAFLTITTASGFRAHPLESTIQDYLIGVRDYKPFEVLGDESDDYDYGVTIPDLVNMTVGGETTMPAGAAGWKLLLSGPEKALARSRIFQNKAYFTTYKPGAAPTSNPCAPAVGTGSLYTIDLETGKVELNILRKPGIPPEPTFIFGPPDDEPLEIDNCYGPHCDNYVDPEDEVCEEGDTSCEEEYEETRPDGRDVECLAGPESCEADGNEFPVRTYWRQLDQSD